MEGGTQAFLFAVWHKTQAFQKLNRKFSKLKHFLISKLNFSGNLSTLDVRKDILFINLKIQFQLSHIFRQIEFRQKKIIEF